MVLPPVPPRGTWESEWRHPGKTDCDADATRPTSDASRTPQTSMRIPLDSRPERHGFVERLVPWLAMLVLGGCATATEIRIHNASTLDYVDIEVAGEPFGTLEAGGTGEYRSVPIRLRYAALSFAADGKRVTGQALSVGARRFTWRIDVVDLDKGWLDIQVVPDDVLTNK